jgi:hypothetical protein
MGRHLPAGLSDAQRIALCEFYERHISAGQLMQRLGIEAPTQTHGSSQHQPPEPEVHREPPRHRAASIGTAPRRRSAITRVIQGLPQSRAEAHRNIGPDLGDALGCSRPPLSTG